MPPAERSKVGREAGRPSILSAGIRRIQGLRGSTARTGLGWRISRFDFFSIGLAGEVFGVGVGAGFAGVGFGTGFGVGETVGFGVGEGLGLGAGVGVESRGVDFGERVGVGGAAARAVGDVFAFGVGVGVGDGVAISVAGLGELRRNGAAASWAESVATMARSGLARRKNLVMQFIFRTENGALAAA